MSITIKRGPRLSNLWSGDGENGQILQLDSCIALRGRITYGQGDTEVEFQIGTENFVELATKMMAVDKISAAKAFGKALSDGFD